MREIIIKDQAVMDFEFQIGKSNAMHFHQNIELLYVLEGSGKLTVDQDTFSLRADDIVLINANKKHSFSGDGQSFIGYFHINFQTLSRILGTNKILFWCNTTIDKNETYEKLRHLMKQIFNQYFEKAGRAGIYLSSLYYQLLNILVSEFLVDWEDQRFKETKNIDDERIAEIINYIHANYQHPISLNDLADRLYLSTPYLSKYIKKKLGFSFIDYVNNIRLFHAVEELLYTDKTIMHIALDNGFANTSSLNAIFKKVHHTAPSEYRQEMRKKSVHSNQKDHSIEQTEVINRLNQYLDQNRIVVKELGSSSNYLMVDRDQKELLKRNWNHTINVGKASDLLRSDMQEHILLLKKELGFRYVRFWDLYSQEMYIGETNQKGEYNFQTLDKILDFLVEHEMYPHIEMAYKPKRILRNIFSPILNEEKEEGFKSYIEIDRFFKGFATHISNRYGVEEIEHWRFEHWKNENLGPESTYDPDPYYFEVFECLYDVMKQISPNIQVGGAGLGIQFGQKNLSQMISLWEQQRCVPDFISLYCYPYIDGKNEEEQRGTRITTDSSFLKNQLSMAKEVLKNSRFTDIPIYVTEWNSTVSNRNVMNDSCYKGAYLIKNILENIGNIEDLGYWLGSDIFSEFYDSKVLLNGGCGLLSKDGIKKPAFYAYDFMDHLGKYLLGMDHNSIITMSEHNRYIIACHNYRHLNYRYYLKQEDEVEIGKQEQMYEDQEEKRLNYQIKNIPNGKYQVKIYSINNDNGSVQDEWKRMDYSQYLTRPEVEYLKRICTPRIFMKTCVVDQGVLNLETKLMPQEIQYLNIKYLYEFQESI